jgi:GAF domain-containing protein
MRRGKSKAKGLKPGGRTRAAGAKPKTRVGRKDASAASSAKKQTAKALELSERVRPQVSPSTDDNIATLRRALAEAHEREAATSDVLKVISRSAFDLQKVLDTLVEAACRLCEAYDVGILLREGESLVVRAHHGPIPIPFVKRPLTRAWTSGRAVLDREPVHVPDIMAAESEFPEGYAMARRFGQRTTFSVPLLRGTEAIGCFAFRRTEVRPFNAKQIELATTFADQAVIAIENARLFDEVQGRTKELTESLEQQTATSEVLQVISSSPGELGPVFQKMLENATRVCGATFGTMNVHENGEFRTVALHNVPEAYGRTRGPASPFRPHPKSALGRVALTRQVAHVADIRTRPPYLEGDPVVVALADLAGARTLLIVPMLKEADLIGTVSIFRQEVKPFNDKQVELLASFASQAVIAIENTRLLKELRQRTADLTEALEQQTATSEVLKVISSVPGALEPVFSAMLENATRICDARFGTLFRFDGEFLHRVAGTGTPSALVEFQLQRGPFKPENASNSLGQVVAAKTPVHVTDGREDANEAETPPVKLGGARSLVAVPMLKDGQLIGAIVIYRQEVRWSSRLRHPRCCK